MGYNHITLKNSRNESITINPDAGAGLISYKKLLDGNLEEMIEIPDVDKYELKNNPFHPSSFLFPFQNRVRNGNYSFLGKNYQLKINETELNNAIHGFIDQSIFSVKEIQENSIRLEFNYDGNIQGYPFPFLFQVKYELVETGDLGIYFEIKNSGKTSLPFSFGWHPYFKWKDKSPKDLTIKFNPKLKFLSDSQMIPLEGIDMNEKNSFNLNNENLDNIFSLSNNVATHQIEMFETTRPDSKLILEFPNKDFNYCCVFIPENYQSVAIEPLTGNTDCFNTEEGLKILKQNEVFKTQIFCKFKI
jgi:aldose 1-epimerase